MPGTQTWMCDNQRIVYSTSGDPAAPPILLVHGFMSHRGVWRQTIPALENDYFCVALDLLGLGESDKPADADYSIPAQARRVLALADTLGIDHFGLMGHSMGGQIALTLAGMIAPQRVNWLIDVDGVTSGKVQPFQQYVVAPCFKLARWLPFLWDLMRQYPALVRPEFGTWFYNFESIPFADWRIDRDMALQRSMYLTVPRIGDAILSFSTVPYLKQITAPTLTIFGRQDAVVPTSEGELVAAHVPNARLEFIERCGHIPMYEQTADYLALVTEFIRQAAAAD